MKLKLDLHVHTSRSRDAFTEPRQLTLWCKSKGLDGIAITDHNRLCDDLPSGLTAIQGIEISSLDGHVIGLGVSDTVKKGLTADETLKEIRRLGGITVIPHPYDIFRSSVNPELLAVTPDAIEVVNASSFLHSISWKRARNYANRSGVPSVAGSDSHIPQTLGMAYTLVESDSKDSDSILEAIKSGAVKPVSGTIRLSHRLRKIALQARKSS